MDIYTMLTHYAPHLPDRFARQLAWRRASESRQVALRSDTSHELTAELATSSDTATRMSVLARPGLPADIVELVAAGDGPPEVAGIVQAQTDPQHRRRLRDQVLTDPRVRIGEDPMFPTLLNDGQVFDHLCATPWLAIPTTKYGWVRDRLTVAQVEQLTDTLLTSASPTDYLPAGIALLDQAWQLTAAQRLALCEWVTAHELFSSPKLAADYRQPAPYGDVRLWLIEIVRALHPQAFTRQSVLDAPVELLTRSLDWTATTGAVASQTLLELTGDDHANLQLLIQLAADRDSSIADVATDLRLLTSQPA